MSKAKVKAALGRKRGVIGGEFGIQKPVFADITANSELTRGLDGTWLLSGRFALARILRKLMGQGVNHVHLPAYLCESVLEPVRCLGLEMSFYPIRDNLSAEPDPPAGSAVLLIHYFGQINRAAADIRGQAGNDFYLIEDASQALLTDWRSDVTEQAYYLISPRKFGPAPLGGWCNISSDSSNSNDEALIAYCSLAARLVKAAYMDDDDGPILPETEKFYLDAFEAVEKVLSAQSGADILPNWVVSLIAGINWSEVAAARLTNLEVLIANLENRFIAPNSPFAPNEIPLGYPILCDNRDELRRKLASRRIFCPVHWPLPAEVSSAQFPEAYSLSEKIMTLPLDQRYTIEDMARLAENVLELS